MPVSGSGQALVRVRAASVNFIDVQRRRGELVGQAFYQRLGASEPDLPATLERQGQESWRHLVLGTASFKPIRSYPAGRCLDQAPIAGLGWP
jgi:hypothetical protein